MSKNIFIIVAVFLVIAGSIVFFMSKKSAPKQSTISQTETQIEETQETQEAYTDIQPTEADKIAQEIAEITLTVSSPAAGSSTTSSKTTVSGKTSPKAEVFANEAEGIADSSGNFSLSVALDEGENSIIVTAVDADGKVAEKEVFITYEINE